MESESRCPCPVLICTSHLQGAVLALCVWRFDWGEEAKRAKSFVLHCTPFLAECEASEECTPLMAEGWDGEEGGNEVDDVCTRLTVEGEEEEGDDEAVARDGR